MCICERGVVAWTLIVPVFFLMMVISSMLGLEKVSLGTFVIVRNTAPILTYFSEMWCIPTREAKKTGGACEQLLTAFSLACLVAAAIIYEHNGILMNGGIVYIVMNMFAMIGDRIAERYMLVQESMECSKQTLSFLNNRCCTRGIGRVCWSGVYVLCIQSLDRS